MWTVQITRMDQAQALISTIHVEFESGRIVPTPTMTMVEVLGSSFRGQALREEKVHCDLKTNISLSCS